MSRFIRHFPRPAVASAEENVPCAGPHFCSMKITEDVRRYAAEQGISDAEALRAGMIDKAREFADIGSELYSQA